MCKQAYAKFEHKQELGCQQGFQYTPLILCSSFSSLKALIDQNKTYPNKIFYS